MVPPPILKRLSLWLAIACCVAILLSIAVSQILLALSLGVLLLSGLPLRWPRIAVPLAMFLGWVLVALAFSPDPAQGMAQVEKIYVFSTMLVVYSAVRRIAEAKWLIYAWIVVGTVTAARGLVQFAGDVAGARAAHSDFYHFYIAARISGFMSHWMTFSGQELFILILAGSLVLFAPRAKGWNWLWLSCALVVGVALVLSETRSIWIAAIVSGIYLLWMWDKRSVLALPVALGLIFLVAPGAVQQRVHSLTNPEKETDSNGHRIVVWRTGWEMIKVHPLVGVGPEEIRKPQVFYAYLPKDIRLPLPDGYYGHLHSIYIHYAAECGVPAAIFLTGALLLALFDFWRAIRTLPRGRSERKFLLHAGAASVIATMVVGIFEKNLGDTEVLTMFLAIMCLGYLAVPGKADIIEVSNTKSLES
ncbi:MAG TPA: O-antigen ligase family protein [Bryobacteraceae bacterium]|nr:O-antigen ligase family protein [Bryobacteraceae bacterium]